MFKKLALACTLFLSSYASQAEPYIDTDNLPLRMSLQQLADTDYIDIPLTTYPLMWNDVIRAVNKIDSGKLSGTDADAYFYIKSEFAKAKRKKSEVKLNIANHDKRFTSFGDTFRNKNNLKYSISNVFDHFAFKISPSITTNPIDGNKVQLNDSYLAVKLGNWNVSVGTQNRWWGPGWDSNLSLTNNARPIPAIALTRNTSEAFHIPFTDNYKIPWTVTSFMGRMEKDRTVPHALLWGFRFNFIPIDNLDIGVVRLAQWGGENRPQNFSTFIDILAGRDNCGLGGLDCGTNGEKEPGNQQAGYDARYSFSILDLPISIYGQYLGEDGKAASNFTFITKAATQFGIDTKFKLLNYSINLFTEYTDTFQFCGDNDIVANCFYEHHIYKTGLRYKGRNLGSLYDNDAKTLVLGVNAQNYEDNFWSFKLRYLQLNTDNSDRYPNQTNGNSLTEIAEDVVMASGYYQKFYKRFNYKVGASYSHSSFIEQASRNQANLSLELTYQL